jgi:hypothetical protein
MRSSPVSNTALLEENFEMRGRLIDAWQYTWPEIWLKLEDLPEVYLDLYMDLYVELAKGLKVPEKEEDKLKFNTEYNVVANDPQRAREFIMTVKGTAFRNDAVLARFFRDALDVYEESGNPELPPEFIRLTKEFVSCHNLRYRVIDPFRLQPHLPGVFAALFAELADFSGTHPQLAEAMADFDHSFDVLSRTHKEADMKTCIHKACMFVECLGAIKPGAKGKTLGDLCANIDCWPHKAVRGAVSSLYGFCSDYPGIRHNISADGQLRALEVKDSVLVALLLMAAGGYFRDNLNMAEIIGIEVGAVA